jgi:hypothetical protein
MINAIAEESFDGFRLRKCPITEDGFEKLKALLQDLPLEKVFVNQDAQKTEHLVQVGRIVIDKQYPQNAYSKADAIVGILNQLLGLLPNGENLQIRRCQTNVLLKDGFIGHHFDTDANPDYKCVIVIALNDEYEGGEYEIRLENSNNSLRIPKHYMLLSSASVWHGIKK